MVVPIGDGKAGVPPLDSKEQRNVVIINKYYNILTTKYTMKRISCIIIISVYRRNIANNKTS